jgi:hypothetical protein
MDKTSGGHFSGDETHTVRTKTVWQCPLDGTSSQGQTQHCQHVIDLVKIAACSANPHRTEELR